MSRLEIDSDRCTGHGRCYSLAPKLFDADEYGHAILVPTDTIDPDAAWAAVQSCPEGAIQFEP
jgi:ferredoxin